VAEPPGGGGFAIESTGSLSDQFLVWIFSVKRPLPSRLVARMCLATNVTLVVGNLQS